MKMMVVSFPRLEPLAKGLLGGRLWVACPL